MDKEDIYIIEYYSPIKKNDGIEISQAQKDKFHMF
jgi:hypothetical protein